jgi:hypothetical protein
MSFFIPGSQSISNTSNGYVGINTLNPQYSLDVNGNINVTGEIYVNTGAVSNLRVNNNINFGGLLTQGTDVSSTGAFYIGVPNTNTNFVTNSVLGVGTLYNSTGTNNVAIGYQSLYNDLGTSGLTAVGYQSLKNNLHGSVFNTAVGYNSLTNNTIGTRNTALGNQTLENCSTGIQNTAVGSISSINLISGTRNTSVGRASLVFNQVGNNNVAIGAESLYRSLTDSNVAVGYAAAAALTGGAFNIFMGQSCGNSSVTGNVSNCILIGYDAELPRSQNNMMVIGDTDSGLIGTNLYTPSFLLGINNTTPLATLHPLSTATTGPVCIIENNSSTYANGTTATGAQSNSQNIFEIRTNNNSSTVGLYNLINAQVKGVNKFRVDNTGQVFGNGAFNTSGADYAEYFEVEPGYTVQVGDPVVLTANGKIRCVDVNDSNLSIIGVVRPKKNGKSSLIGNSAWNEWSKKYVLDEWGVPETEEYTVYSWTEVIHNIIPAIEELGKPQIDKVKYRERTSLTPPSSDIEYIDLNTTIQIRNKMNPLYDETIPYIPREERDEWQVVGLLGQVYHNKNKPMKATWVKLKDVGINSQLVFIR